MRSRWLTPRTAVTLLNNDYLWQFTFLDVSGRVRGHRSDHRLGRHGRPHQFTSYLVYSVVISAVIYPVSGHWIWNARLLAKLVFTDFAGSTVVHSVGGWPH
jgi:hypothetical protein